MGRLLYGQKKKKRSLFSSIKKLVKSVVWFVHPKRVLPPVIFVAGVLALICALTLTFSSMDPVPVEDYLNKSVEWTGPFAVNKDLQISRRTQGGIVNGPRSVTYDRMSGLVYVAETSGNLYAMKPDEVGTPGAGESNFLIHVSGNIVAMRSIMGLLFVADSKHGLHTVDPREKKSAVLIPLNVVKPPITSLSDFCMTESGIIYLADSSLDHPATAFNKQLLEGKCTGRIIAFNIVQNESMVIKENLCMPTSVEISPETDQLLISETARGRISAMRLNDTEIVSHHYFPALPGKIRANQRSSMWLTLHAVKDDFFTMVKPFTWVRKLLGSLVPEFLLRSLMFEYHGAVAEIHMNATPIDSLHDPTGMFHDWVTDVMEAPPSVLFLGNDNSRYLGRMGEKPRDGEQQQHPHQGHGGMDFDPRQFEQGNTEL